MYLSERKKKAISSLLDSYTTWVSARAVVRMTAFSWLISALPWPYHKAQATQTKLLCRSSDASLSINCIICFLKVLWYHWKKDANLGQVMTSGNWTILREKSSPDKQQLTYLLSYQHRALWSQPQQLLWWWESKECGNIHRRRWHWSWSLKQAESISCLFLEVNKLVQQKQMGQVRAQLYQARICSVWRQPDLSPELEWPGYANTRTRHCMYKVPTTFWTWRILLLMCCYNHYSAFPSMHVYNMHTITKHIFQQIHFISWMLSPCYNRASPCRNVTACQHFKFRLQNLISSFTLLQLMK